MASELRRDIPNFGTATFRIPGFGLVMHLRKLADEAQEPNRAALFTNRVLAAMLVEPEMAPEEIENLPRDSVTALIQAAADVLEIRQHYERTSERLPARTRFYEAYLEYEKELLEPLSNAIKLQGEVLEELQSTVGGLLRQLGQRPPLARQMAEYLARPLLPAPVIDFNLPTIDPSYWARAFDVSQSIADLVRPLIEAPTTLAEEIRGIFSGLTDAVVHMSANLAAVTIAAEESSLLGLFDNLMAVVQPHLDAAEAFNAGGWPIAPSMPSELIAHVVTMHSQGRTQYISRAIMGHYQRNGQQHLRSAVESWRAHHLILPRMHVLKDALEAHCQGLYTLSVPAMLPQIEGVLRDYVHANGLPARIDKIREVYTAAIGDPDEYALPHWAIVSTLLYQLQTNTYHFTDFRIELEKSINTRRVTRHTVLHGVAPRYDRPIHSLKAFLLLDAVSALEDVEE